MNTIHQKEVLTIRQRQLRLWPLQLSTGNELLKQLGPIQAQEYLQGRRAVGLRLQNYTAANFETEVTAGKIVRSWMFRGTLHFAEADQVREILAVLQPVVSKLLTPMLKQLGIDTADLKKATQVIEKYLSKHTIATRDEIGDALTQKNIPEANKQRLRYFLHHATVIGLICHAPRRGNEDTFTLIDSFLPASSTFVREVAVQNTISRYFSSHGPASVADAARWTGLPITEVKKAVANLDKTFEQALFDNETVYFKTPTSSGDEIPLQLLAGFDEYIVGYKNRNHFLDPQFAPKAVTANGLFHPTIIRDGHVTGIWKLENSRKEWQLKLDVFNSFGSLQKQELNAAINRLISFENRMIKLM